MANANNTSPAPAAAERQLYVVEFSAVAVWAAENERLSGLVYNASDFYPEIAESYLWEDTGYDEDELGYDILNNRDGSSDQD